MTAITTKIILDQVFTRVRDNSATLRVKMLGWLNSAMREVWAERAWIFLEKTVDLPISGGSITLPADFGDETFIRIGDSFVFTTGDKLTPSDAARYDVAGGDPAGYTSDGTYITFHPAATGIVSLSYVAKVPDDGYQDGTGATIFPMEFLGLFERAMLEAYYEYDVDTDRLPNGIRLNQEGLRRMKKLDNSRKPLPQLNNRGLVRAS